MGENRFKRALFGISPQKVSSYLRQLRNLQEKELSELEAKVQAQLAEQQRLLAERDQLYARRQAQTAVFDCQDVILQRVPEAIRVLQQHTQQEVANLQAQIAQKRREHQWKLENIERQTESYNQALQELIMELGATMAKLNTSTFDEADLFKRVETTVGVASEAEQVAPVAATEEIVALANAGVAQVEAVEEVVEAAVVAEPQTLEEMPVDMPESADAELAKVDNVIQFKVKFVTDRAARLRNGTENGLDAGSGTSSQGTETMSQANAQTVSSQASAQQASAQQASAQQASAQQAHAQQAHAQQASAQQATTQQSSAHHATALHSAAQHATAQAFTRPVLPVHEPIVSLEPSSFWGDIGQFVSGGATVQEVAEDLRVSMEMPAFAEEAPATKSNPATSAHTTTTTASSQLQTPSTTSSPSSTSQEPPTASPHAYEMAASKESEAVSTEIASIRNRYIVGKVAGEDLLDGQNRLIVAKGEVISAEVVEIAEREGRLPDLIVNMKIPGVTLDKA